MDDVAIIGVGLHAFGRHGDKSAFEMGADAVTEALADAGVAWTDVNCAFGGSWEVAQADPLVGLVGLTGIPFINVFNACATGAAITQQAANAIVAGSDHIARGVLDALRDEGRSVPGDVAVIGFDNWDVLVRESRPTLTSVDMNLEQLGRAAAQHLVDAIGGSTSAGVTYGAVRVHERESTG